MNTQEKIAGGRAGLMFAVAAMLLGLVIVALFGQLGLISTLYLGKTQVLVSLTASLATLFLTGHFMGRKAGVDILVRKRNWALEGLLVAGCCLILPALVGSGTALAYDYLWHWKIGFSDVWTYSRDIEDYFFKPLEWLAIFGVVPAIVLGILCGRFTKNKMFI